MPVPVFRVSHAAMNAHIAQELQHLTAAEKHALGPALIGSADSEANYLSERGLHGHFQAAGTTRSR